MNRTDGLWIGMKLLGLYFLIIGLSDLGHGISGSIGYNWVGRNEGGDLLRYMVYESHRNVLSAAIMVIGGLVLLRIATLTFRKQHKAKTVSELEIGKKVDETSATQP